VACEDAGWVRQPRSAAYVLDQIEQLSERDRLSQESGGL
jgi:hypothetical protein